MSSSTDLLHAAFRTVQLLSMIGTECTAPESSSYQFHDGFRFMIATHRVQTGTQRPSLSAFVTLPRLIESLSSTRPRRNHKPPHRFARTPAKHTGTRMRARPLISQARGSQLFTVITHFRRLPPGTAAMSGHGRRQGCPSTSTLDGNATG